MELLLQAMESKLLCGGKNIVDHTNEQQRALEQRRQEIAEQQVLYSTCLLTQCFASMVYANALCLSVCMSITKHLDTESCKQCHKAQGL